MRLIAFIVVSIAFVGLLANLGAASKRASQPNPVNGSVRALSELVR